MPSYLALRQTDLNSTRVLVEPQLLEEVDALGVTTHYMQALHCGKCTCRQHPWFRQHLPRYLPVRQSNAKSTPVLVDPELVEKVVRLGFTRDEVAPTQ